MHEHTNWQRTVKYLTVALPSFRPGVNSAPAQVGSSDRKDVTVTEMVGVFAKHQLKVNGLV